jgi:hypothetical protein
MSLLKWIQSGALEGTTGFTDFGIENLKEPIEIH